MSVWGPTAAYIEGSGFPREFGAWSKEQMIQALKQMVESREISEQLRNELLVYYRQMANGGYVSPEEISAIGQRVMPWVDQMIADRNTRQGQIGDLWAGRRTSGDLFDPIYGRFNDQAGDIVRTGELNQGEIQDSFGRAYGRNEGANNAINNTLAQGYGSIGEGINNTFGSARQASSRVGRDLLDATNQAYGGLRDTSGQVYGGLEEDMGGTYDRLMGKAGETFGGLKGQTEGTYDEALAEVERLRPNSDLVAGRRSRAWAPTVAASAQRLRRLGIGPNDLQGVTAMQAVEGDRARSIDDAMADEMSSFADRRNSLVLGRQGARERLGLGELGYTTEAELGRQAGRERLRLGNLENTQGLTEREQGIGRGIVTDALGRDITLSIGQHDRTAQNTQGAMRDANAEQVRNLMAATGLDLARAQAIVENNNLGFDRTQAWRSGLNQADVARFGLDRDDLAASQNLLREQNANDMVAHGLQSDRYSAGQNWTNNDIARRDTGYGNLMGLMQNQQGWSNQNSNNANRWGQTAFGAYGQAAQQDAGRGGWGWNLLASAAPALSMIPVVGPALGSLAGGIGGTGAARQPGRQGGAQGGQGGGGWGGVIQPFTQALQGWRSGRQQGGGFNPGGYDYLMGGGYR